MGYIFGKKGDFPLQKQHFRSLIIQHIFVRKVTTVLLIVFDLKSTSSEVCSIMDSTDIRYRLGQRIKSLREKIGMSQKDLAYASDLDRSYIAGIEAGSRNVSIVNIEKITSALGVSLSDFFDTYEFNNPTGT